MIEYEVVLELHENLVLDKECLGGVREEGLLKSAIVGQQWYDDILMQYTHVAYSINANHIFNDGNKRTCYLVLKRLNSFGFIFDDYKLANFILDLAKNTVSKETFFFWVCSCIISDNRKDYTKD